MKVHLEPGRPCAFDQPLDVGEGWLGISRRWQVLTDEPDQGAEFTDRLLACLPDLREGLPGSIGVAVEHLISDAGLQHNKPEAVADDVVQLPRNSAALLLGGVGGSDRLLRLQGCGASVEGAHSKPGDKWKSERHDAERRVPHRLSGACPTLLETAKIRPTAMAYARLSP